LAGDLRVTDGERPHDFNAALAEYSRLLDAYPPLGYDVMVLPKADVLERANIVLTTLAQETS
jgi:predicted ATPase